MLVRNMMKWAFHISFFLNIKSMKNWHWQQHYNRDTRQYFSDTVYRVTAYLQWCNNYTKHMNIKHASAYQMSTQIWQWPNADITRNDHQSSLPFIKMLSHTLAMLDKRWKKICILEALYIRCKESGQSCYKAREQILHRIPVSNGNVQLLATV